MMKQYQQSQIYLDIRETGIAILILAKTVMKETESTTKENVKQTYMTEV